MALEPVDRMAPEVQLLGESDREVALSTLFDEAPTVLVFLRHFG